MKVWSDSFREGSAIPSEFAFCMIDTAHHVKLAANHNPHIAWADVPANVRSFAVVCHDPDVPSKPDDLFKEDREIPSDLPRVDFFHWALIDLPASTRAIEAGSYSKDVTPRGKNGPAALNGTRQAVNDYTGWFANDHDMSGDYFGFDGPCPPWNDSIVHRYFFTVYALDIDRVSLDGRFTAADVLKAIEGHVIGRATVHGTYTLNPRLA